MQSFFKKYIYLKNLLDLSVGRKRACPRPPLIFGPELRSTWPGCQKLQKRQTFFRDPTHPGVHLPLRPSVTSRRSAVHRVLFKSILHHYAWNAELFSASYLDLCYLLLWVIKPYDNQGYDFFLNKGLFEHVWDPLSQKQTTLAIKLIRGMAEVYPNFHAQDKTTQVAQIKPGWFRT